VGLQLSEILSFVFGFEAPSPLASLSCDGRLIDFPFLFVCLVSEFHPFRSVLQTFQGLRMHMSFPVKDDDDDDDVNTLTALFESQYYELGVGRFTFRLCYHRARLTWLP
jgi:hypothetical protein